MNARSAVRLYSPEVLALATRLADFPLTPDLPLLGSARSSVCGSTIQMGLALDAQGSISRIGLRVQACAIGQAAAAIFANAAAGATAGTVRDTLATLQDWLAGNGPLPDWPGLIAIAPAREFSGRHGAIVLPWNAAIEALSTPGNPG